MKTYRSKIGLEIVLPLSLLLGGIMILLAALKLWVAAGIVALTALFAGHLLATTRYTIRGTTLRIVSGFFYDISIDIKTIQSVKKMRNAMSSPAASLDRMEIRYDGLKTVLISPKDKLGFVKHLRSVNPSISAESFGDEYIRF